LSLTGVFDLSVVLVASIRREPRIASAAATSPL